MRDVPAVAVCATCGDPSCPGHDFEMSGERPINRTFAWEDGQTPPMRAMWRTAMASASDLELWVRASLSQDAGVGPPATFALSCELVAVITSCLPLAAIAATLAWVGTHDVRAVFTVFAVAARVGAVFIPAMIVIHVVYQAVLARAGGRRGKPIARVAAIRAGLYSCGWDLATGPAGILASLLSGEWREARSRAGGNNTLFRQATRTWLSRVHGVEGELAEQARRATWPWMVVLLLLTVVLVGWTFVASL